MKRVLSGIRPTGMIHIGNYFGALKNWVLLQSEPDNQCFYMIADIHALTTDYADTSQTKFNTIEAIKTLLSIGIDAGKSVLFIQSMVPAHSELHLLLSMITPLGWLERVPSYKEIQNEFKGKDLSTYGFLGYPVLQAADIVIYDTDIVPVGKDQIPHIELTREIVRRFNYIFGNGKEIIKEPRGLLTTVPNVLGTDGRKMSKSYKNCIYLTDTDKEIEEKIFPMLTDTNRKRRTDPGDTEKCPVFSLHRIFTTPDEQSEITRKCTNALFGCLDCKKILLNNMKKELAPIRARRAEIDANPSLVAEVIKDGAARAGLAAGKILKRIKEAINLAG